VADYWTELGKVQIALGSYSAAYYAFARASELDRSDPTVLRMLTQLSLSSGNLDLANQYARQLDLLSPGDPAVRMTYGIIAMRRGDLEGASRHAEQILTIQPAYSDAIVLQAEVLLRSGKTEEAATLLTRQIGARPNDVLSYRALVNVYDLVGDRRHVADLRKQIWALNPKDGRAALDYIGAAFRAGDIAEARAASLSLLKPDAPPAQISATLDMWREYWPGPARLEEARRLSRPAGREQKFAFAAFFNSIREPADAIRLVRTAARLPVSAENVRPNAILATSLVLAGKLDAARARVHDVLLLDPDNVEALRARTRLNLMTKARPAAINDAQKLVSLTPASAGDRLLLAQCYQANGDDRNARRVLWDAFNEIPADPNVYAALRNFLARTGDMDSVQKVDSEFAEQKKAMFTKIFA
jgi:predicted Zn-dependent protease